MKITEQKVFEAMGFVADAGRILQNAEALLGRVDDSKRFLNLIEDIQADLEYVRMELQIRLQEARGDY